MNTTAITPVLSDTVQYDASSALQYRQKAQAMSTSAQALVIDSEEMLQLAGEDLRSVKALQKQVEETRTSITGPLNQALQAVNALFRQPAEYLQQAERTLKTCIGNYQAEQQRIADLARQEAARKQAEERKRLAEEAAAAEAEAAALRQAAMQTEDVEQLTILERQAEQQQIAAQAAQAMSQVVVAAPVAVAPAKVSGISGRKVYNAEVTDLRALLQAVLDGKAPIEAIQPDMKFLGAQAKAFKKEGPLFPGVVATAATTISARA